MLVPTKVFLTKGVGSNKEELRSFEIALRDAGIEKCNLVAGSGVLPPGCKIISKNEGLKELRSGMITFAVVARSASNEPRRLIASSIGLAKPADDAAYGYLSVHQAYGETDEIAGDYAEDLAACMLASSLGIEFDEEKSWDEKKELFNINEQIVKTSNITQSTIIGINGWYSTAIAAAVFLF